MPKKTIKTQLKPVNPVGAHNLVDYIIRYETGEADESDIISLFQYLIDSGKAWTLQGHYGRTASALIKAGYCHQ